MAKIKFDGDGNKEREIVVGGSKSKSNGKVERTASSTSNGTTGVTPTNGQKKRIYFDPDDDQAQQSTDAASQSQKAKARRKASKNVDFNLRNKMLETRQQLPIWSGRDALIQTIQANNIVVVLGETGSGKTTQLPQFLLESGIGGGLKIAVTQPRRVAAISLANRVSQETGTQLGSLVGYSVRFDDMSWKGTALKYMTDGMLMRELLSDQLLSQYGVIVIDEAHERTLRTDLILGTLKSIMQRRSNASLPPLKVVVMSATLDAEKFSTFFHSAPVLYVKGRQHPVRILNANEDVQDYMDGALKTIFQIHQSQPLPGDILVFLPGQEEINSLGASISMFADGAQLKHDIVILKLYASLSPQQQQKVFEAAPSNTRKIILATNVAETSITIAGVRHVIDSGLARERKFYTSNNGIGIDTLFVKPISKSSAMQRAGRAGREAAGVCYRLYTENTFLKLSKTTPPEIERTNLNFAILQLKAISEETYQQFEWLDEPSTEAIQQAHINLFGLGALDTHGIITDLGKKMAGMPLDPAIARILLSAQERECVSNILSLCALLSVDSPLFTSTNQDGDDATRERFASRHGDHIGLLNIWAAYGEVAAGGANADVKEWCSSNKISERTLRRAKDIRAQLEHQCRRMGMDVSLSTQDEEIILQCVLQGMFQNVALRQGDGTYRQIVNHGAVKIHPTSSLLNRKAPCIMYHELTLTTATYARTCSSIHPAWLRSVAFYNQREST
ncbi:hypothetical protein E3P99_03107 [Wallemia hederae]|uniref:RNA helicase n=1 Tax=Wallemia hederae TaxID=1540922 RepID=A0A4V4LSZ0_9BASI|nr:hypothetical protein E3P99_03107 [Wallemia hederae]